MLSSSADLQLAQRVASGDDNAFAEIYQKHYRHIYRYILGFVCDKFEAEDIAQEVFMRAYTAIYTYSGRAPMSSWLRTIARNLCIDRSRKREVGPILWSTLSSGEERDSVLDFADPGPSPEEAVCSRALQALVMSQVEALPERYRQVVLFRDLSDMSCSEAAQAIKCPEGTVKSRLSRAHHILRNRLYRSLAMESAG